MILVYLVSRFYRYLFLICSFSLLLCFSFYFARIFIFFFLPFFPLFPYYFDKITILDVDVGIYCLSFVLFLFYLFLSFSPFLILCRYTSFILWDYDSGVSCLSFLSIFISNLVLLFSSLLFLFLFRPDFYLLFPPFFSFISMLFR